jgi:hypothetical protein
MSNETIQCPACRATLLNLAFNQPELTPCPSCGTKLLVDVLPAFFRRQAVGQEGELVLVEGESSCFYHPQKKAVVPCDACGRFVCALCDCEVHGQHLCPACLESGHKKEKIQGIEASRPLHGRLAFALSIFPFFITGLIAIYLALRYRREPLSLVRPRAWQFPAALVLASLQTLAFVAWIVYLIAH